MKTRFTVGIEEEFQMVDRRTGHLCPRIQTIMEKGYPIFGDLSMRQSISELLDFVDEVLEDLGSRREIDYLRTLLCDPWGTGADRQIALYQRTHSIEAVLRLLMQQTMQGLPEESSALAV